MRACVIFNPAAKGEKAERFRQLLDSISKDCDLKRTQAAGDARLLAAKACAEGFDTVFASGGDGTLNEVVNGLAESPGALEKVRLGFLPLGTINVFARELGIPLDPATAWEKLKRAGEKKIDLPYIESGMPEARRFYFAQMAGAGLDAKAIQLVDWSLKKKFGPLAYVAAGLKAMCSAQPEIKVADGVKILSGQLVLIGNGKLYGGDYRIFPGAELSDGLLEICLFPKVNWWVLLCSGFELLWNGRLDESFVVRHRAKSFSLNGAAGTAFEVDGELAGKLPARVGLLPNALRVLCP